MARPLFSVLPDAPVVDWLFLDMNAYFASVEQQVRKELRGQPVAVVPIAAKHTCCIAVSYEAKAFGIKTGMSLEEAKALCPQIVLVEGRPKLYVEYHQRIIAAVENCVPVSNVISIDEMVCQLIGRERSLPNARTIALEVKAAIREVGDWLRCSVGLAPNRLLAKLASKMQKPDGLTVLLREELPASLYRLKPSDVPGIGTRMDLRLQKRGITTMEQLCSLSKEQMHSVWNGVQDRMWLWLHGANFAESDAALQRKSIGKQHVLAPKFRSKEKAYGVAIKLLHTAAANMRKLSMRARRISVSVYYWNKSDPPHSSGYTPWEDRASWEAHRAIPASCDTHTLQFYLGELWESCPSDVIPFSVSIWFYNLIPEAMHSLSLFEEAENRNSQASLVMDLLNKKYGVHTVYLGGMHNARDSAPTRIAFMSIPKLDEF